MSCYKEIELLQGSDEWKQWRYEHVTATDTAKILGKNPWVSAYDCYLEKIEHTEPFITPAMQQGIEKEKEARNLLMVLNGLDLKPKVFESNVYSFMGASLDAVNNDNAVGFEIKCPGEKAMMRALNNDIPELYEWQCQKQMLVMGWEKMELFYYHNDYVYSSIPVIRDESKIKKIVKEETRFYEENILKKTPPEKYEKYKKIKSENANNLAESWIELDQRIKHDTKQKQEIEKQLKELTDEENSLFVQAGLKYNKFERKGIIDWKKACLNWEITAEEQEKYRKNSSSYSKFTIIK